MTRRVPVLASDTVTRRDPHIELWSEVLAIAWNDAAVKLNIAAIRFFNEQNGHFSQLCLLLDLQEHAIRRRLNKRLEHRRSTISNNARRYRQQSHNQQSEGKGTEWTADVTSILKTM